MRWRRIDNKSMAKVAVLLLALLAAPAAAETARVVDGDSLEIAGQPVRLWGIDAPEAAQTCERGGKPWACGHEATAHLERLTAGRDVACTERTRDRYRRVVAVCTVDGRDIGAAMVEAGMALAFRRYSLDYVAHEDRARAARRGMWQGEFVPPWEYRQARSGR